MLSWCRPCAGAYGPTWMTPGAAVHRGVRSPTPASSAARPLRAQTQARVGLADRRQGDRRALGLVGAQLVDLGARLIEQIAGGDDTPLALTGVPPVNKSLQGIQRCDPASAC